MAKWRNETCLRIDGQNRKPPCRDYGLKYGIAKQRCVARDFPIFYENRGRPTCLRECFPRRAWYYGNPERAANTTNAREIRTHRRRPEWARVQDTQDFGAAS